MKNRLLLSALLALAATSAGHAGIVWSGPMDLPAPLTFDGLYLNPFTGTTAAAQPADWNSAPWLNPFFGGVYIGSDELLRPVITGADQVVNLDAGETIGAASTFAGGESGSSTHVGPATDQFQLDAPGYLGFAFATATGGPTYYGWVRITVRNTGAGTLHEWAYEDAAGTAIPAGAVPEPGSALLFGLGVAMCVAQRRRKTAAHEVLGQVGQRNGAGEF